MCKQGRGHEQTAVAIYAVSNGKKRRSIGDLKERTMLDHIILSVSDVERSLRSMKQH